MQRKEGVAAWLLNDRRLLLGGVRQGSHGADSWASPGGHREPGEGVAETASRELLEETGLRVSPDELVIFSATTDDIAADKLYTTFHCIARLAQGREKDVTVLEPDKCKGWLWRSWWQLCDDSDRMFVPTKNMLSLQSARALQSVDRWACRALLLCGAVRDERIAQLCESRGLCCVAADQLWSVEARHAFGLVVDCVSSPEELLRVKECLAAAGLAVEGVVGESEAVCGSAGLKWIARLEDVFL